MDADGVDLVRSGTVATGFSGAPRVSDYAAGSALEAITKAHTRATALRGAARTMREDVAERVSAVADRMDADA
ncbi:MAG: hypothetical protein AAF222_14675, partial [Pseudomonadota bacterium]